jgi:hypothetical protein
MDEMGLPGLSEAQCFVFKDVIAKLKALSGEQLAAFKDGIAKVKSRGPLWNALQELPTLKQKRDAIAKFRKNLDGICRFAKSVANPEAEIYAALVGADLSPELADTEKDALVGGYLDVAEWLSGADKINALARQLEDALAKRHEEKLSVAETSVPRLGPVPLGPRNRLIGVALPDLYVKVFGNKFSSTRTPDIEFVRACLALLGDAVPVREDFIRDCVKKARRRAREQATNPWG